VVKALGLIRSIDYAVLRPESSPLDVEKACKEAKKYGFAAVCVCTAYIPLCVTLLTGSGVKACAAVGFPLGSAASEVKAYEASWAIRKGAGEVDAVMNIGLLKSGSLNDVKRDVEAVVNAVKKANPEALVKIIIETGLLTDEEKVLASKLVAEAGADFVKTCTGFNPGEANVEDVKLIRLTTGGKVGIKASGGIKSLSQALKLMEAGATRIGSSKAVLIAEEALKRC